MHRLQELVRLHRMGTGAREASPLLEMSPNTERAYRTGLEPRSCSTARPTHCQISTCCGARSSSCCLAATQAEPAARVKDRAVDGTRVTTMVDAGATPTAIYDALRLKEKEFVGSLSWIKRMCRRIRVAKGVDPNDVAIPVDTEAGEIAQVEFGSIGQLWDPEQGKLRDARDAYVFVLVLGFSRHMVVRIVLDQKLDTWLRLRVETFAELGPVPGVLGVLVPDTSRPRSSAPRSASATRRYSTAATANWRATSASRSIRRRRSILERRAKSSPRSSTSSALLRCESQFQQAILKFWIFA